MTINVLLLGLWATALGMAGPAEEILVGSRAREIGEIRFEPESLEFTLGAAVCHVSKLGVGVCRTEGVVKPFRLPLTEYNEISKLYTLPFEADFLVAYEFSDVETGAATVVRLDAKDLGVRWKAWVPGFNLGLPLLRKDSLFVTAIGFVGRIRCKNGHYAWKHSDLYEKQHAFNSFGTPRIEGKFILLPEEVPQFESRLPKRLRVDIDNGAVTIEDGA